MPEIMKDRPPFVTFEVKPEEDRTASIETGHYVAKDVDYACITPAGSKDRVERVVDDWFAYLEDQVGQGRFPREWLAGYREKYRLWKQGQELPLEGTPIRTWSVASPAQVKMLLDLHVLTVEDLVSANEETLSRLGMGGRDLQRRARDWVKASSDVGKVVSELSATKLALEAATQRSESLESQIQQLQAQVARLAAQSPQKT